MLKLRKTAACILALLSMAVSVSAANIPEPNEVIKGQSGELQTIQKVYVLPKTDEEITADNNHVYIGGNEVEPLATGLMVLGHYKNPNSQYNKKDTFIQYE